MRRLNLTSQERSIEERLIRGEYFDVDKDAFAAVADAVAARKKDIVLNIRMNSQDLKNIKQRAEKLGIRYQTFISEILHRVARA